MSIEFTVEGTGGFFTARFVGGVTDEELINAYTQFFEGDEWCPGMNELVDHSEFSGNLFTTEGLQRVARFAEQHYQQHGVSAVKTAIFAPRDLPFGLSRIYEALTRKSPETVMVFRQRQNAVDWLGAAG